MPVSVAPLTPLRFLERSSEVFPDKTAIVDGERRIAYRDFAAEATRVARGLQASGIGPGDRVAYLCPNIAEMLVAHFAVPLAGAVLVAINTRLAPEEVRYICDHSGAKLIVADAELLPTLAPVAGELGGDEAPAVVGLRVAVQENDGRPVARDRDPVRGLVDREPPVLEPGDPRVAGHRSGRATQSVPSPLSARARSAGASRGTPTCPPGRPRRPRCGS